MGIKEENKEVEIDQMLTRSTLSQHRVIEIATVGPRLKLLKILTVAGLVMSLSIPPVVY